MRQHVAAVSAIAYASMAIATFGHAAAASDKSAQKSAAACEAKGKGPYCRGPIAMPVMDGLLSAIIWPLYWSWELQA